MQDEAGAPLTAADAPDRPDAPTTSSSLDTSDTAIDDDAAPPRDRSALFRLLAVTAVVSYAADQASKAWALSALDPGAAGRGRRGVHPAQPHPQRRRGLLHRQQRHVAADDRGLRRARLHPPHGPPHRQPRLGLGARDAARRLGRQPHRPHGAGSPGPAGATSSTSSTTSGCSSATSPTSRSSGRPCSSALLALRGIGVDGKRPHHGRHEAAMIDARDPVRPRGPRGGAGRHRDLAALRRLAHQGGRARRLGHRPGQPPCGRQVRAGQRRRPARGGAAAAASRARACKVIAEPVPGMTHHPRRRRPRRRRQARRGRGPPERRAGPGPRSWGASPRRATASRRAVPASGRASCRASTSAPPA